MALKASPAPKNALPRELQRSPPRPVVLNANGVIVAVALISLLLAAVGGGLWIYQEATGDAAMSQRLAAEGRQTEAVVTKIEQKSADGNRRFLYYRYSVDGREFTGVTRLFKGDRTRFSIGSTISIRYLPGNPRAKWVRGYEPNAVPLWLAPVMLVALLLSAVPLGWLLRRQRRLLAYGRTALARVLTTEKIRGRGEATWRVHYDWQLLSGAVQRGKYEATKTPPQPGTLIPIVYDREHPRRHARYPLSLVRITRP
jgi:hypothetical protein